MEQSTDQCQKHEVNLQRVIGSPTGFKCPICQREDLEAREQERVKQAMANYEALRTTGVLKNKSIVTDDTLWTAGFKNYDLKNDEQKANLRKAIEIAKKYIANKDFFNTILTGNAGTGKSHLAMAILKTVNVKSDPPRQCLFVSWDKVVRDIRTGYFSKDGSGLDEGATIKLLSDVDLLVIDDLGAELGLIATSKGATDYVARVLYAVLNARQSKSTIFTTNLSSVDIDKNYDAKIASRIRRRSADHTITFRETEDQRLYY
ncbi:ATP-binding protein [Aerococcus mictus]|uniref:ATP-binding protein n=1 Tax=Aerococcus mictus TaxID=2976810 RepID=UPI0030D4A356|nr:ATP-binding protein [Aerococcus urinae]